MIEIQELTLDAETAKFYGLTPSVDFLKIDGASASVNEKLKASIDTADLAASTHATANNYFKNVNSVSARCITQRHDFYEQTVRFRNHKIFTMITCLIIRVNTGPHQKISTLQYGNQEVKSSLLCHR